MRGLILVFSLICSLPGIAATLDELIEQDWTMLISRSPLMATSSGLAGYNHLLDDASFEALQAYRAEDSALLTQIDELDTSALDNQHQINHALLRWRVASRIESFDIGEYTMPLNTFWSFFNSPVQTMADTPLRTEKDFRDLHLRLRAMPLFFIQNQDNMRKGLAQGLILPSIVVEAVMGTIDAQIYQDAAQNPLWQKATAYPEKFSDTLQTELSLELDIALTMGFKAAFTEFSRFMHEEYLPAARQSVGASQMTNGEAYYQSQIHQYVTSDEWGAKDIHQIGLNEVARIRNEMDQVIAQTGFEGSFAEFAEFLRTSSQFYSPTARDLLKEASYIAKRIDYVMPKFFKTLPRNPYGVQEVPAEIAPAYSTAAYWPAMVGGDRGGAYMVNTYRLNQRPLYELPALTLHESVPGHHHQGSLSQELENVPEFRKHLYFSAYGEGWGLYAEKLGIEMDIYEDAYQHFGRLSYEMWRACRLVIDTGIHAMGWTRQQGLDYLADNTALSLENVRSEVDRYISWPGQALSYKMGELTIWELRHEAEAALGERFDLREFHDAVLLNGALPLDLLRAQVRRWINAQLAEAA
jgi:uncharacterized protein (DUF885 family)